MFECLKCKAENANDATSCVKCNESTIVATFKSIGTGTTPKDFVWPLMPCDAKIGSTAINDIILPNSKIPTDACRLSYENNGFVVSPNYEHLVLHQGKFLSPEAPRKLLHGEVIQVGSEQLRLLYVKISPQEKRRQSMASREQARKDLENARNPISMRLMLILGYLQELHSTLDLNELMNSSLDAVIKVANLDKAYAFLVEYDDEGNAQLQEMGARSADGVDLKEEEYSISQTVLTKVIHGGDVVFIEDTGDEIDMTSNSLVNFDIKTVVCMPLTYFDAETQETIIRAIIYADKAFLKGRLPDHCRSTLQLLSQMISGNLQKIQEVATLTDSYDTYLKQLSERICDIKVKLEDTNLVEDGMSMLNEIVDEINEG